MTVDFDTVVIGGGVIGIATARALALTGQSVIVLESEAAIAQHQSSRNSEVIHAGIYYPAGSLKAKCCIAGKGRLYDYCIARGVPHRRVGKLIVATTEDEAERLDAIRQAAADAGMPDLSPLSGDEARKMEPELACVAALWSPTTGIIDSQAYILSLVGDLEAAGGSIATRAKADAVDRDDHGFVVTVQAEGELMSLRSAHVVNACGAFAPAMSRRIAGLSTASIPAGGFAKGNYFSLATRSPFSHLIYPVPVPGGLGTHLTLDMGGQARFGPDVEWTDEVDYNVDPARAEGFVAAIRRYWPGLPDNALVPAYSGIRAKIGPRGSAQDFVLSGPQDHGIPGLLCLYGIESPGLTSSLVVADLAAGRLLGS